MIHLFLNSNPWFSAVTDYSLQLVLYLKRNETSSKNSGQPLLFCAESGSTFMDKKCAENNIHFKNVPLHNHTNIFKVFKSFIIILYLLIKNRNSLRFIWVFEGREHTLCGLSKLFFPFLWKGKTLIRIRGQAQQMNTRLGTSFFSKLLYRKLTDKVIFAAKCIEDRANFDLPHEKIFIHYYGKGKVDFNSMPSRSAALRDDKSAAQPAEYFFHKKLPSLNADNFILLVIARFDPVKGHDSLLKAFLQANFKNARGETVKAQLVFIGHDATLKSKDMYEEYLASFEYGQHFENNYFLENNDKSKNLFIINKKIYDLEKIIKMSHFGVIPSLGSEVICRVGVEFLQQGTPVLSSDAGALTEVFSDFPFFIFKAGKTDDLKNKLEQSLRVFLDTRQYLFWRFQAEKTWINKYSGDNYARLMEIIK